MTRASVDEAAAEAERLTGDVAAAEESVGAAAAASATARATLDALDEEIAAQSALVSRHDLELAGLAAKLDVARSKLAAARGEHLRQSHALEQAGERRDRAAEVVLAGVLDGGRGGVEVVGEDGVGDRAEGRGDRGLEAGPHLDVLGDDGAGQRRAGRQNASRGRNRVVEGGQDRQHAAVVDDPHVRAGFEPVFRAHRGRNHHPPLG